MGKRKRSKDESELLEKVMKKVKKLVRKKRRISSSSSDGCETPSQGVCLSPAQSPASMNLCDYVPDEGNEDVTAATENVNLVTEEENSQLDPEVLELLGSDPTQVKEFGDDLHKEVANRWKHILLNGLTKEEKSELSKNYLPAENCAFIRPPKLNPEVKSALHDLNIKKDAYSEKKQDVMASCLSAIGKALNMTLTERHSDPELIKILSDAGRLLCDIHHRESVSRRFAIINAVNKSKRDTIKNTKIDHNLFGSNLTEHLKTSKAISVSASELRYNSSNHQQRAQLNTTMPRSQPALNVRGAPRAPVAEPRAYPRQPRRPPPPPPPAPAQWEYRRAPPPPPQATRPRNYSRPPQNRRR
ncbi:arp2/3 complex-activating protein rickA [Plutella xylostella]|uniref:arp2/3 complex-activating protein rickA n=1 Tax=Plutella xylostella TaxID=51655 RepID=UPI0020325B91|nr:arp2/3 complex-activating protein rickA [Plutella xylostella]